MMSRKPSVPAVRPRYRRWLLLAAALLPLHAAALPHVELPADPGPDVLRTPMREPQQGEITPQQAARIARERHGGRVLGVRRSGDIYRVKLLRDGEISIVRVPVRP